MGAVSGVYAAAITPRRTGPEADLGALFELIDRLSASGVDGIALMGSTGEFPHFELEERRRLVTLAAKRSQLPVIAGIGHSTLDGALSLARSAADAGVAALLLMPPYFFQYRQEEIREFYLSFAREFKEGPPVLLYNIPAFTSGISCQTAIELLATGLFAGIKDSSGSWDEFARLGAVRRDQPFSLLVGIDSIFREARKVGADGVVSGCASAVPELLVALNRAITAGNEDAAGRLDARLQEFMSWMRCFPLPVAIREAVAVRGIAPGPSAVPLGPEGQARLGEFREWFREWLPLVEGECRFDEQVR